MIYGIRWVLLAFLINVFTNDDIGAVVIDAKSQKRMEDSTMDQKQYERIHGLHMGWYVRAVNSLMGAMGREMYLKMSKPDRVAFLRCFDEIPHDHDLQKGSKCLVAFWDKKLKMNTTAPPPKHKDSSKQIGHLKSIVIRRKFPPSTLSTLQSNAKASKSSLKSLQLKKESPRLTRLRQRVYRLEPKLKVEAERYRKELQQKWHQRRLKKRDVHLIDQDDKEAKNEYLSMFSEFSPRNMDKAPDLIGTPKVEPKSPVRQLTNMFTNLLHEVDKNNSRIAPWKQSLSQLKKLNEMISQGKKERDYRHRMLDYVTNFDEKYRKKVPFMEKFRNLVPERENMPKMLKGAYDLIDTLSNYTEMLNAKILSPKIGSIIDQQRDKDTFHFLSPNILPFYKDDSPNSILPLPDVLDEAGLRPDDKDAILELVMEVSGAHEIVRDAFKIFSTNETAQLMEDVDGVTETLNGIFEQVKSLFNRGQRTEMAQKKYTFLNKEQAVLLYGSKGPYNNTLGIDLEDYGKWTAIDKKRALMDCIRRLADGSPLEDELWGNSLNPTGIRRKRSLTTLSPFSFAPSVLSPAFLGPVTLSPNLFSPNILTPTVLRSPYVMSPNTISPAVFEVYVLSPYAIAPNVLNPYVMSPIILSPHVLCPDVLSPTVLSGAILNPYVLGPAVLTQSVLAADVLSPSLLSRK